MPATVGSERAAGVPLVEIWCGDCQRHGKVSTDGKPAETPIPDICLRYRCLACGSRNLTSRPGVIADYAVLQERTDMGHGTR